jgi:hypothetical protein
MPNLVRPIINDIAAEHPDAEAISGGVATVYLSGGSVGSNYAVVNRITTAAGRVDERTITILVRDR